MALKLKHYSCKSQSNRNCCFDNQLIHLHTFSVWCNIAIWLKTKAYSPLQEGAYAPNAHLLPSTPLTKTS